MLAGRGGKAGRDFHASVQSASSTRRPVNPFAQLAGLELEPQSQSRHGLQTRIAAASFNIGDVGSVQVGPVRKLPLGQAEVFASVADLVTKCLKKSCSQIHRCRSSGRSPSRQLTSPRFPGVRQGEALRHPGTALRLVATAGAPNDRHPSRRGSCGQAKEYGVRIGMVRSFWDSAATPPVLFCFHELARSSISRGGNKAFCDPANCSPAFLELPGPSPGRQG